MTGVAGDQAGFSLVEQLIAVALVAIVAMALLGGLSGGTLGVGVVDEQVTASGLANSALEAAKAAAYVTGTASYGVSVAAPPGYEVRVSATAVITGLQWITATVLHNGRQAVELAGYKANR